VPLVAIQRHPKDRSIANVLILSPQSRAAMVWSAVRAASLLAVRRRVARALGRGDWPVLNGQMNRQRAMMTIVDAYRPDLIVETGTYLGSSTGWFAAWGAPVFSAEVNRTFFLASAIRRRGEANVTLALGDSVTLLERLAGDATQRRRPLFYLDAHWEGRLPLREELAVIWAHWPTAMVVIDDFKVPGDDGYGFDDYGPGQAISLEYCRVPSDVNVMFPSEPSRSETGRRRGTCYLAVGRDAVVALDRAAELGHVRRDGTGATRAFRQDPTL
jgi:hypothetical protein